MQADESEKANCLRENWAEGNLDLSKQITAEKYFWRLEKSPIEKSIINLVPSQMQYLFIGGRDPFVTQVDALSSSQGKY
jgi:hypothetical protein